MKCQPDEYSLENIFECPFNEDGTEGGNAIFEGRFKISVSEARKNLDRKASADQGVNQGEKAINKLLLIFDK